MKKSVFLKMTRLMLAAAVSAAALWALEPAKPKPSPPHQAAKKSDSAGVKLMSYDLSAYTEAQQKAIVAEAEGTPCGCGRGLSVYDCLRVNRLCAIAPRLAEEIIARVTGAPYMKVQINRALSDGPIAGVDLKKLPDAQAKKLLTTLQKMRCGCGCSMTLLDCLKNDPTCEASPTLLAKTYKRIIGADLPGAVFAAPAGKKVVRYDAIPGADFSMLNEEQKAKVIQLANERPCLCGCGMTVAECRNDDPTCEMSPKLLNAIIFEVATGAK